MKKILITEFMDEAGLALLRDEADLSVQYEPELVNDRANLLAKLPGVAALIVRNQTQVDPQLVAAAQALQVVGRLGVGLDNISLLPLKEREIELVVPLGANAQAVAEWTMGAMLGLTRQFIRATLSINRGEWKRNLYGGQELAGKTLGLIGFGDIARRVARRALAFDMRLATFDPYLPEAVSVEWHSRLTRFSHLEELLPVSDFISLHVPLTDETRHLLNRTRLNMLPPGACVINSARGGLVDEEALLELLKAGRLGGVALDVRRSEPPPQPDPLAVSELNVILTPHVAGLTAEAQQRVSLEVARGVLTALSKKEG